jgi:hypothetical protein
MSKYKVTHSPPGSVDTVDEEVEANAVRPINAGDTHFIAFVQMGPGEAEDTRLVLPADTIYRVEKIS